MLEIIKKLLPNNPKSIFTVGKTINIERTYLKEQNVHQTTIREAYDEYIFVDFIKNPEGVVTLRQDARIRIFLNTPEGIWAGSSVVWEVVSTIPQGIWLTLPTEVDKIQDREFARWNVVVPVTFTAKTADGQIEIIDAMTNNISAGGLSVLAKKPLNVYESLSVSFTFDNIEINSDIKFIYGTSFEVQQENEEQDDNIQSGVSVEQSGLQTPKEIAYNAGMQFVDIDKKLQTEINQYINKLMDIEKKSNSK